MFFAIPETNNSDDVKRYVEAATNYCLDIKKVNGDELAATLLYFGTDGLVASVHILDEDEIPRCSAFFSGLCHRDLALVVDSWTLSPSAFKENEEEARKLVGSSEISLGEIYNDINHPMHKWVTESLMMSGFVANGEEWFHVRVPYAKVEGEYISADQQIGSTDIRMIDVMKMAKSTFPEEGISKMFIDGFKMDDDAAGVSTQLFGMVFAAMNIPVLIDLSGGETQAMVEVIDIMWEKFSEVAGHFGVFGTYPGVINLRNGEGEIVARYPKE